MDDRPSGGDLPSEHPLIITARVNETSVNAANPSFPYRPKEIIREAVRAFEAGARILHWHARRPGEPGIADDDDAYLEVYEEVRARTDLLLQPGIGSISKPAAERVRHVTSAASEPSRAVDLVSVELGSFNIDFWDPLARRFATLDGLYDLRRDRIAEVIRLLERSGVAVSAACWDLAQVRTAALFQESGLLGRPALFELVFNGPTVPSAPAPTLLNLQAMAASVPWGQPWMASCWLGDAMRLAAWAVTLGGHVGIGLGDFDYTRLGTPDTGELVGRVAEIAATVGRPIATPAQARQLIGVQ